MTMENAGHFQSQLTSLMNAVVTAAVVEIVRLVEDSAVVLRQQLSKSKLENEALKVENESNKKKLQILEGRSMAATQRSVARCHEADGRKCNSCVDGWKLSGLHWLCYTIYFGANNQTCILWFLLFMVIV